MTTEKTRAVAVFCVVTLTLLLVLGGLLWLALGLRAQSAQRRAQADLKERNPVEYYLRHTPLTQTEDELRQALVGAWQLAGAKSLQSGEFVRLENPWNFRKTFTLTNWAMVAYDSQSNVLYTAGGPYTLQGENYTEAIETATGAKAQFLGTRPTFRIRLEGDKLYEMGLGNHPSVEQMWQRAE